MRGAAIDRSTLTRALLNDTNPTRVLKRMQYQERSSHPIHSHSSILVALLTPAESIF